MQLNKFVIGATAGAILGAIDGLSAWFSPEARSMMLPIVLGSTLKGVATGLAAGAVARWRQSVTVGVCAGLLAGFVLSSVAAIAQGDHYLEIILPGMLVGAIVGFVTQRYPHVTRTQGSLTVVMLAVLCGALSIGSAGVNAQSPPDADPLAPLARLIGRWTGTSEGQPGSGRVEREYERVLGSRFIQIRNRSIYPPQDKNPKGETHEDLGFLSFDRARKRIVFRQFHIEGFVNQYVIEPGTSLDRLVFVTESIENIPAGFRARETYVFSGADQLEEIFEIAEPGKDFAVYSRTRLIKTP